MRKLYLSLLCALALCCCTKNSITVVTEEGKGVRVRTVDGSGKHELASFKYNGNKVIITNKQK